MNYQVFVAEETSVPSERDQETVANQETQLPEALGEEECWLVCQGNELFDIYLYT